MEEEIRIKAGRLHKLRETGKEGRWEREGKKSKQENTTKRNLKTVHTQRKTIKKIRQKEKKVSTS